MKRTIQLSIGFLALSMGWVFADTISKPHNFVADTPASASQVNADFDVLYDQVNKIGSVVNVVNDNVGIGTTSPIYSFHVAKCDDSDGRSLAIGNTAVNGTFLYMGPRGCSGGYNVIQSITSEGVSYGNLVLQPNGGNIGIGTTNPISRLHIVGATHQGTPTSGNTHLPYTDDWHYLSGNGVIFRNSAMNREVMRVDANTGNVGIGTTNPGSRLTIYENASDYFDIDPGNAGDGGRLWLVSWANGWNLNTTTANKNFYLNRDAPPSSNLYLGRNGNELFVAGATGNVGIGTTNPMYKLDLGTSCCGAGLSKKLALYSAPNDFYGFGIDPGELSIYAGDTKKMVIKSDGKVGIGTLSPSAKLHVAGTIRHQGLVQESDERLKENVQTLASSLDKIAMLRGVSYQWRNKHGKKDRSHMGVIAQDVEKVFPELVFTADDEQGTKAVDYNGLVAPLIESVKQLKEENKKLKTRADAHRAQTTIALKVQADSFKAQIAALTALLCQDHPSATVCNMVQ